MTASDNGLSNGAIVSRLLRLAWRYRSWCIAMLLLQFVLMGSAVALVQLGGIGIDLVRFHTHQTTEPPVLPFAMQGSPETSPLAQVGFVALALAGVALLRAILNFAYAMTSAHLVHRRIVSDLRSEVYEKLQRMSLRFYSGRAPGTIINRVTGDVQATRMFIDGVLIQLSILVLSLVCYLYFMLRIHVGLTLACLATTPLIWIISVRFSRRVRPMYDHTRELFDALVLRVAESVEGAVVIKSTGRQKAEIERFDDANHDLRDQQKEVFYRVSRFSPLVQFLTQLNLVILLCYGGYLVVQNQIALGAGLVVFAGLLQQFSSQVSNLSGLVGSIQQSLAGARRVFEILDANEEIQPPAHPIHVPQVTGHVCLENISFGYTSDNLVLQDIHLEIHPGERVGVLGTVGAGKTTLLSLIPRFFDPLSGSVSIDGVDVRRWDPKQLRTTVGMVLQEPLLLSNTIATNIAFGVPHATPEAIRQAARWAAADRFIEALPEGYETVLGEFGMTLSGGQRQRLALARALLTNPRILLLDDPVSALDPETEHEILETMQEIAKTRTTIIVANRLSTLRGVDRILVLDQGRIVQSGTHQELIGIDGPYRLVAASQGYPGLNTPQEALHE